MGTPITECAIHVNTCLNNTTRKPIALIDGFPMIFKGDTPMKAKRKADDWRREAVANDKLLTKAQKAALLGETVE